MTLREWLEEPFTLTLSSGFFGFFAHAGLVTVLAEAGLIPQRITGCSAGALTGALWAAGLEPDELMAFYKSVNKADFWDPGFGLGVLKGQKFRDLLAEHSPVQRLEQCAIPVAISVFDVKRCETQVFEAGPLPELVYASCAVPPLFQPLRFERRLYSDGAFKDTGGLAGARDNDRVLFHQLLSRSERKNKKNLIGSHYDRVDLKKVRISGVPAVGPNHLAVGSQAFDVARNEFAKLLDLPSNNFD